MSYNKKLAGDAAAMETVLGARLPLFGSGEAFTSSKGQAETARMVTEKMAATVAGTFAAQQYLALWPLKAVFDPHCEDPMSGAVDAFMGPGRDTLHKNAERLKKRR